MPSKLPIAGIILAAGMSNRYGSPKQIAALNGRYLIEWVIDAASCSKFEKLFLVLGCGWDDIIRALAKKIRYYDIQIIVNRRYCEGLSRSIQSGLLWAESFPSVMFLLGDQPLVETSIINLLIERFRESDKNIAVPIFEGKRGNPVIFGRKYYSLLMSLKGDTGGRNIIRAYPDDVLFVEIPDSRSFFDVDTREELYFLKYLKYVQTGNV